MPQSNTGETVVRETRERNVYNDVITETKYNLYTSRVEL